MGKETVVACIVIQNSWRRSYKTWKTLSGQPTSGSRIRVWTYRMRSMYCNIWTAVSVGNAVGTYRRTLSLCTGHTFSRDCYNETRMGWIIQKEKQIQCIGEITWKVVRSEQRMKIKGPLNYNDHPAFCLRHGGNEVMVVWLVLENCRVRI